MGVVKGLKHPHAAMLLVDYILSKEGQEILRERRIFPGRSGGAAAADAGSGRAEDAPACRRISSGPTS